MIALDSLLGWRPAEHLPYYLPRLDHGVWFEIEDMSSREVAYMLYITDPRLSAGPLAKRIMLYATPVSRNQQIVMERTDLSQRELNMCAKIVSAILRSHMTINEVQADTVHARIAYHMTNTAMNIDVTGYYSRDGVYIMADIAISTELRDLAVDMVAWYNKSHRLEPVLVFLKERGYPIAWALDLRRVTEKADYKAVADWLRSIPRSEQEQARMVFTGLIKYLF